MCLWGYVLVYARARTAAAADVKGKLEYQPALTGLDYGKVTDIYYELFINIHDEGIHSTIFEH